MKSVHQRQFLRWRHFHLWILAAVWLGLIPNACAATSVLVPSNALWRYRPGINEPSPGNLPEWRQVTFDDSTWATGPAPFYYGEDLFGTLIEGMSGVYSTLYLRHKFQLPDPTKIDNLRWVAACDDGFILWLNGEVVAFYNVPTAVLERPTFDSVVGNAVAEPAQDLEYPLRNPQSLLRPKDNVLALQVFNATLSSSDLVLNGYLEASSDEVPPTLINQVPPSDAIVRQLALVEVEFSEDVSGVDAADFLVNDAPATGVQIVSPAQYVFTFPPAPAGPVKFAFRANHGITDLSGARNAFSGAAWSIQVDPTSPPESVLISEFLASNDRGIRDEDGDESDWIELYNGGSQSVSLAGWHLTDSTNSITRWTFPLVSIPARSFLLVWASGKNRTTSGAPLHTNFKLAKEGGYLGLYSPDRKVSSEFAPQYPAQQTDASFGRVTGAPQRIGYFATPTPRAINSLTGPGFAPEVVPSLPARPYQNSISIQLQFSTNQPVPAGAVIRYTLDNSIPTENSFLYTGPLEFTNRLVQLRSRAFAPSYFPGPPRTDSYIPLSPGAASFRSDLPVLLIHDFDRGRPPGSRRIPAIIQEFLPGADGFATFTNTPIRSSRAEIGARGSSTEGYGKVSLRVEFQDEFGFDQGIPFLELPKEADWILYAPNNFEPVLTHNPFMHQLSRDIGRYSPRTRFCEVYLVTRGTNAVATSSYNGIYVLQERIEISSDRVDAGSLAPENLTPPSVTGGYMMKIDRIDPGDGGIFAGGAFFGLVEPREAELMLPERAPQLNYLRQYMNAFGDALDGPRFSDPALGYRAYIDTPSWIDHHLLNVLAFNVDALRLSAYFYKPREGKLAFGPLWDFDRALYSTDGRDQNPRVWRSQVSDRGTDFFGYGTQAWWGRLFEDLEFFQEWIDRYHYLRQGEFSTTNLLRLQDDLAAQVRAAQPRETAKWGLTFRGGSYATEVVNTKRWISNRVTFMDGQFVRPPEFDTTNRMLDRPLDLRLILPTNTSGAANYTIFYTLDGTDPRLRGGGTSANARIYSEPIKLSQNTRVIARSRNPNPVQFTGPDNPPLASQWSGRIDATFVATPPPIVVSEIHFNPRAPGIADGDDFEFIELLNRGSTSVALLGYSLEGGIQFTFTSTNPVTSLAPAGRVLIVRNRAQFLQRHPTAAALIAGEYLGNLSNGGNRLTLFGPVREPGFDFRYRDDWEPLADGLGHSLVLADEATPVTELGQAATWRASAMPDGSPGQKDAASTGSNLRLTFKLAPGTGILELEATAQSGREYVLETASSLDRPRWTAAWTNMAGPQRRISWSLPARSGQNFIRVLER